MRPEEKHTNIPPEESTAFTLRLTIITPKETTTVTLRHTTIPPQETSEQYDFFSWFTQSTDYITRVIIQKYSYFSHTFLSNTLYNFAIFLFT
jgi:hypothetical protein